MTRPPVGGVAHWLGDQPAPPVPARSHQLPLAGTEVTFTLPDGRAARVPVATARQMGLVTVSDDGQVQLTDAGRAAGAQLVGAAPQAATRRRPTARPSAGAGTGAIASSRNLESVSAKAVLPSGEKAPKGPSEALANMASTVFLARNVIKIANGPGLPSWEYAYYTANGVNRLMGGKLLPGFLEKGPIKDFLQFQLVGGVTAGSVKALPAALAGYRTALQQAAQGAGRVGLGARVKALLAPGKPANPEVAAPAASAAAAAAGGESLIGKLGKLLKPLYYIGFSLSAASGIAALPEYLAKTNGKGLVTTTSGRGAVLGALGGVAMLGALFLPGGSAAAAIADVASNVLWIAEIVNGKGWLDGVLGGDSGAAALALLKPNS